MSQVLTRAAILNANKMQAEVIGELRAQVESLTAKLTNEHDVALTWHRHNMELAARNIALKAQVKSLEDTNAKENLTIIELMAKVESMTRERDRANAGRLATEKDLVHAYTLVDHLRDALSFLRIRILEVYSGPSPLLDEAWEKSRKALAQETHEHD